MTDQKNSQGPDQAQEELVRKIGVLGSAVAETLKGSFKDAIVDTIQSAESKVKQTISEINPRTFIKNHQASSIIGAFGVGLLAALQTHKEEPGEPKIPGQGSTVLFTAVATLGLDLLRAYALKQINDHSGPATEAHPSQTEIPVDIQGLPFE